MPSCSTAKAPKKATDKALTLPPLPWQSIKKGTDLPLREQVFLFDKRNNLFGHGMRVGNSLLVDGAHYPLTRYTHFIVCRGVA